MVGHWELHGKGDSDLVHEGWVGDYESEGGGVCIPKRGAEWQGPEEGHRGLSHGLRWARVWAGGAGTAGTGGVWTSPYPGVVTRSLGRF